MNEKQKSKLLCLAESAASLAGKHLKMNRAEWQDIQSHSGHDVKIKADRKSEELIIGELRSGAPISIFSEETGLIEGTTAKNDNGLRWIIDPLDGSLNYHQGVPLCCVSIALYEKDKPILGVVYDFNHEELFKGSSGVGAWLNDKPIKPSRTRDVSKAVLGTGFPVSTDFSTKALQKFIEEIQQYRKVRLLGSAALSLCYVACGRIDAYRENNIMFWDVAAGCALVSFAGGAIYMDSCSVEKPSTVYANNGSLEIN